MPTPTPPPVPGTPVAALVRTFDSAEPQPAPPLAIEPAPPVAPEKRVAVRIRRDDGGAPLAAAPAAPPRRGGDRPRRDAAPREAFAKRRPTR